MINGIIGFFEKVVRFSSGLAREISLFNDSVINLLMGALIFLTNLATMKTVFIYNPSLTLLAVLLWAGAISVIYYITDQIGPKWSMAKASLVAGILHLFFCGGFEALILVTLYGVLLDFLILLTNDAKNMTPLSIVCLFLGAFSVRHLLTASGSDLIKFMELFVFTILVFGVANIGVAFATKITKT